ncbi:T6SS immunity protein Tdi1 domain-containing protein [Variovorax ureilyticus]|uniref:T6SS immunity protein Tdi1 domain-containing protein n=1 Tax=Variovorax ureilyticus TaxID=1836198 RepID=UPI003D66C8EA
MFETFRNVFQPDEREDLAVAQATPKSGDPEVDQLLEQFGGQSFNQGIYRVISAGAVARWAERATNAFPRFVGRVTPFGVDWLGRLFALDSARHVDGMTAVVMLEPGTGQALEVPCGLVAFHDAELVQYMEEALAEGFYKKWRATGGAAPRVGQCVGYKRPLFLGGADTTDNLELAKLEVYWETSAQLLDKTRDLPVGTHVNNISIN